MIARTEYRVTGAKYEYFEKFREFIKEQIRNNIADYLKNNIEQDLIDISTKHYPELCEIDVRGEVAVIPVSEYRKLKKYERYCEMARLTETIETYFEVE